MGIIKYILKCLKVIITEKITGKEPNILFIVVIQKINYSTESIFPF